MEFGAETQPRFLLYGITGVFNYGCEAIVRGTTAALRGVWPHCRVFYASHRCEEDRRALRGCDVEVFPTLSRYQPRRVLTSALRRLGFSVRPHLLPISAGRLQEFDGVLSIGGDLYTMPWVEPPRKYLGPLVDFGEMVMRGQKSLAIWGASIGPFDKNPWALPLFQDHFQRVSLITARESWTVEYLASMGVEENVREVADPAYLMRPDGQVEGRPTARERRPLIGVNLSPLSARRAFPGETVEAAQQRAAAMLRGLIESLDVDVLLIPHVICRHDAGDDDYRYLDGIRERLTSLHSRLELLSGDLGARKTKAVIGRCDAVVAARMHCSIASLSSQVPTLLLGYSAKAKAMAEYVYGHGDWVADLATLTSEELTAKVGGVLKARPSVIDHLRERIPVCERAARAGAEFLQPVLQRGVPV